jgi:hypothetical protein
MGMVLALLSGCGLRDCTLVGPPSTITVDTVRVVGAHDGRLVARLCLNDSCTFNQHSSRLSVIDIDDSITRSDADRAALIGRL